MLLRVSSRHNLVSTRAAPQYQLLQLRGCSLQAHAWEVRGGSADPRWCRYPGPGTRRYFGELGEMLVQKAEEAAEDSRDACPLSASASHGQSKARKRSVAAQKRPNGKAQKGGSRSTPNSAHSAGAALNVAVVQGPSPHAQQSSADTSSRSPSPLPTESAESPASELPVVPPPPPGAAAWCAQIANEVRQTFHHFTYSFDRGDLFKPTTHVRMPLITIGFLHQCTVGPRYPQHSITKSLDNR